MIIESDQRTRFSADFQDRFRWAVCQLDALQWLRCERYIVQNALAHIPKTLFETYDRIFLSIPEDERLFVHHALQWICFNNEVHDQADMSCVVLLQAVERSIACAVKSQTDRFVDEDTLQRLYGCLISIEPLSFWNMKNDVGYSTPTVSFAHYTVREYVDSARFPEMSRAYYEACTAIFLNLTSSQAQHVESRRQEITKALKSGKTVGQVFTTDFTVYCVVSALSLLQRWALPIPRPHTLNSLAFVLLDPSKPHFKILTKIMLTLDGFKSTYAPTLIEARLNAFTINWKLDVTDTDAAVLFYLVVLKLRDSDGFPLARTFLQDRESTRLLQSRLAFRDPKTDCVIDGSIIEVLVEYGTTVEKIEPILHYGAGLFDPSKVLVVLVGRLLKTTDIALIEYFLKLGADPCGAEFYITPLQIAVYLGYIQVAQTLLKAGANPNGIGNMDGIQFKENSRTGQFNSLHQVRPLNICRWRIWFVSLETSRDIEDLLLRFGAEIDPNGNSAV